MKPASGDYDPFEEFSRHYGAGRVRDPYPGLAALQRAGPVHKLNLDGLMGKELQLPPGIAREIFVVLGHEAVGEVLRDAATFSSRGYADTMGQVMGRSILEMDAPEHGRYRALIRQAFGRVALERWECPLTAILRTATRTVRIGDTEIPAGGAVSVNLASANRDETRYPNPDAFDVFREPKAHMAFAVGPHHCLGMHLARMEMRIVLETLFERLPALRLDPEAEDVHISGTAFRSPLALPVRFTPELASREGGRR